VHLRACFVRECEREVAYVDAMRGQSSTKSPLARRGLVTLLALTLWSFAVPASAQVNAEALRSNLRKNPRFLWLEGSVVGRAGNTQMLTFSSSAFAGLTADPHLFFARLAADYGQSRGDTTVARWMAHARYNYRLTPLVAVEALAQVQHDEFRRLAVRDLYGGGLRFELVREEDLEVFAGTTYLLEHEVVETVPDSLPYANVWHRSSNYGGVNLRVDTRVDLSTVTYIQPRFDRPLDFRVLSETFVSFTISKLLSARVSGTLWYDHRPPFGVLPFDLEVKNSLVVKF